MMSIDGAPAFSAVLHRVSCCFHCILKVTAGTRAALVSKDVEELRRLHGIRTEIASAEKADLVPTDKYGNSVLHEAARRGLVEVVDALLELDGYTVDMRNGAQDTPLHMASAAGHPEVAQLLLENGATVEVSIAESECSEYIVWPYIVSHAIYANAVCQAQTAWTMTPLYWAANGGQPGHRKVAKLLLNEGADLNFQNKVRSSVISVCCRKLTAGCSKLQGGYTPLHEAAREGHVEMCEMLLDAGADSNLREIAGGTPLHLAAEMGHTELVSTLLKPKFSQQIDKNARRYDGHTALSLAGQRDKDQVVGLLLDSGAEWAGKPWKSDGDGSSSQSPSGSSSNGKRRKRHQKKKTNKT
eukprot:SAG31_NODE_3407_length_4307_cov_8.014971_3_plen_356_part_00